MIPEPINYKEFKIFHFGKGFTELLFYGRLSLFFTTYFVATKGQEAYVFSFGVNSVEAALHSVSLNEQELVQEAIASVKDRLDQSGLEDKQEYTYEYYFESERPGFKPKENPVWKSVEGV